MEGGQSEIEQKQQGFGSQSVENPLQLHAAGNADLPETSSNLPKVTLMNRDEPDAWNSTRLRALKGSVQMFLVPL